MVKLISIFMLFSLVVPRFSFSQLSPHELTFVGGQGFYSFLYKDQTPQDIMNLKYKPGFSYGIRYWWNSDDKNFLRAELGVFQAGGRGFYAGNLVQWNLNYLTLGANYLYKFWDRERRDDFSVAIGPALNMSYLMGGQQIINKLSYDLKGSDAFKKMNFHGGVIVSARYFTTRRLHFSLEYRFDCSLGQIEGADASDGQKTRNIGHVISVGVGFRLR